jgi:hypothetical protein
MNKHSSIFDTDFNHYAFQNKEYLKRTHFIENKNIELYIRSCNPFDNNTVVKWNYHRKEFDSIKNK